MSSGIIGGRIGGRLSKYLVLRYGKSNASIGVGIVVAIVALILSWLYFRYQPAVSESDLLPATIEVTRFNVGKSSLDIWAGTQLYTARARFWRPEFSDDTLNNSLRTARTVRVWLHPGSLRIFGLEAGRLVIPTSAGVAEYMGNRRAFLWLWVAFLAGGICCLGQGLWLKRRERLLQAAA